MGNKGADYRAPGGGNDMILGHSNGTLAAGNTRYMAISGSDAGFAVNSYGEPWPTPGILSDLYCLLQNGPGGAETVTFTVYLNGAPTALVVVITGAAVAGQDLVNQVVVAAGDFVEMRVTFSVAAANNLCRWGLRRD